MKELALAIGITAALGWAGWQAGQVLYPTEVGTARLHGWSVFLERETGSVRGGDGGVEVRREDEVQAGEYDGIYDELGEHP